MNTDFARAKGDLYDITVSVETTGRYGRGVFTQEILYDSATGKAVDIKGQPQFLLLGDETIDRIIKPYLSGELKPGQELEGGNTVSVTEFEAKKLDKQRYLAVRRLIDGLVQLQEETDMKLNVQRSLLEHECRNVRLLV